MVDVASAEETTNEWFDFIIAFVQRAGGAQRKCTSDSNVKH